MNQGWAKIGGENQQIIVPPNTLVRYGAGMNFVERVFSGAFVASNATFGDPAPGVAKSLEVLGTWVTVGGEGSQVNVAPNTYVRYGAGVKFVEKLVSGTIVASNATFGDPCPGQHKSIQMLQHTQPMVQQPPMHMKVAVFPQAIMNQAAAAALPESPKMHHGWVRIGGENEQFIVPHNTLVRYGAGMHFAERVFSGPFTSSNATFGDPAPGVAKGIEVMGSWVTVGGENSQVNVPPNTYVRYGAGVKFSQKLMSGIFVANNAAFGDPCPGVHKTVQMLQHA